MKKTIAIVLAMFLCISLMTACTGEDNTQTTETTVPASHIETMNMEDTLPAGTSPTQTTLNEPGETHNADYYSVCTNCTKSEVEQFAKEVRECILAEDWERLSEFVAYPITIAGVTYEDSTSFLTAPFGTQLDEDSMESIRNESCTDMFCNYAGIMMGNGEVWIGEVLNEDYSSAGLHVIGLNILKVTEDVQ